MGLPHSTHTAQIHSQSAKYDPAAGYETPATNLARSRKEATVTIYDRIYLKAEHVLSMPQVYHGQKFYIWDTPTLKVFLEANESLKVWAMAPTGKSRVQPWEVVASATLSAWGAEYSFTRAAYAQFVSQIKAALARIKK